MSVGRLALRGTIGALFIGHGTQKLFGWFGGHGPEGTGGFFESLGLKPGRQNAMAAGVAEAGGGALILLGAATPLGATMVSSTMITAMRTAHKGKGPWVTDGGWEYNVVVAAAVTALAETGPGSPSLDARLFPKMHGPVWAALSIGAAIAGSYLVTSRGTQQETAEPAATAEPATGRTEGDGRFTRSDEERAAAAAASAASTTA
jgi:putative oxidoreductase